MLARLNSFLDVIGRTCFLDLSRCPHPLAYDPLCSLQSQQLYLFDFYSAIRVLATPVREESLPFRIYVIRLGPPEWSRMLYVTRSVPLITSAIFPFPPEIIHSGIRQRKSFWGLIFCLLHFPWNVSSMRSWVLHVLFTVISLASGT